MWLAAPLQKRADTASSPLPPREDTLSSLPPARGPEVSLTMLLLDLGLPEL